MRTVLLPVSICFSHNDATFFRITCPDQGGFEIPLLFVSTTLLLLRKSADKSWLIANYGAKSIIMVGPENCYVLLLIGRFEESCRSVTECKTGLFIKNDLRGTLGLCNSESVRFKGSTKNWWRCKVIFITV